MPALILIKTKVIVLHFDYSRFQCGHTFTLIDDGIIMALTLVNTWKCKTNKPYLIFSPQNQQLSWAAKSLATYRDATLNCAATRDRDRESEREGEWAKFALNSLEAINSYLVSRLNQININLRSQLETVEQLHLQWNMQLGNLVAYSQLDVEIEDGTMCLSVFRNSQPFARAT